MRLTDDRYAGEIRQFELALRMIQHEARTRTIRECTGLSDDRIRKVYVTYFRNSGATQIRRHRGMSPRQISRFVKNPHNQLEATTLVALYCSGRLLKVDVNRKVHACWPRPDVEYGHRVCRAYETYQMLHPDARLNFEWAWNLLQTFFPLPQTQLDTAQLIHGNMSHGCLASEAIHDDGNPLPIAMRPFGFEAEISPRKNVGHIFQPSHEEFAHLCDFGRRIDFARQLKERLVSRERRQRAFSGH